MQINCTTGLTGVTKSTSQNQSFGAHIPKALREELFYEANKRGHKACDAFFKQAKSVEEWGHDTCAISKVSKRLVDGSKDESLVLIDSYVAPFQQAKLPKKPTLLDSFMALTHKIVVDAENTFKL